MRFGKNHGRTVIFSGVPSQSHSVASHSAWTRVELVARDAMRLLGIFPSRPPDLPRRAPASYRLGSGCMESAIDWSCGLGAGSGLRSRLVFCRVNQSVTSNLHFDGDAETLEARRRVARGVGCWLGARAVVCSGLVLWLRRVSSRSAILSLRLCRCRRLCSRPRRRRCGLEMPGGCWGRRSRA
jgi:hypothetical protein